MAEEKNTAVEEKVNQQDALDKKDDITPSNSQEQKSKSKSKAKKEKNKENNSNKKKKNNKENEEVTYNDEKYDYVIKNRQIRKHAKQQKLIKAMLIFLAVSIVLGGGVYGMITMLEYNNFKVLIDKEGMNILSLSHSESFDYPTEVLSLSGPNYMDNITLMDIYYLLPEIEATEGNYGEKDEKNFVASTFYLKNVSDRDQVLRESIIIKDITKDVDDAIRVMVIRNSEKTVYAKTKENGEPEEVVPGQYYTEDGGFTQDPDKIWMSQPFASPNRVFYETGVPLAAGEVRKYTLLVWLEGWDPECVNEILGGTIKLEFQFSRQTN